MTDLVSKLEGDATSAEESIAKFRADVTAKIAALEALAQIDHDRISAAVNEFTAFRLHVEAKIVSTEARFEAFETGAKSIVARVRGWFGGSK